MEFERAIFRVYDKFMENLISDEDDDVSPTKSCLLFERIVSCIAFILLFILVFLHMSFVGSSGCLPRILSQIPNDSYDNNSTKYVYSSALQLRNDQILGIDIDTNFISSSNAYLDNKIDSQFFNSLLKVYFPWNLHDMKLEKNKQHNNFYQYFSSSKKSLSIADNTSNSNSSSISSIHNTTKHKFDFQFAFQIGILALSQEIRDSHNFTTINITLTDSDDDCFGNSFTKTLIPWGGIDIILKNFIQSTFEREGTLVSQTGDYSNWSKAEMSTSLHPPSILKSLSLKFSVLLISLCSFFMISSITALLVRILISSGVVLIFPLFYALQRFNFHAINWRLISLSYPWIGIPIEMIRARNRSATPFIMAHLIRIILFYLLYEACQFAFSNWFFDDYQPGQRELWLFAIMMLLEYYSMIYLRSRNSILLFPRVVICLYLMLHFYIYLQPSGFHLLAILVMFSFLLWAMIFCVRKYEFEAYTRGHVNMDNPRVLHNEIPYPVWSVAEAPDFSLFWPIDTESTSVYGNATDINIVSTENNTATSNDPEIGIRNDNPERNSNLTRRFSLNISSTAGAYSSIPSTNSA